MTAFQNLAPDAVQKLTGQTDEPAALQRAAAQAGHHYDLIALTGVKGKRERLDAIARALHFPAHFGHNLDALYDCLADMEPNRVIILRGLGTDPESHAILAVFRDAARHVAEQGKALRVLYD